MAVDRDRATDRRLPKGQTSRGPEASNSTNPKNNSSRRPDVVRPASPNLPTGQDNRGFPVVDEPGNRFNRGTSATEPNPDIVPRGYGEVPGPPVTVRRNTSANRQRFDINPPE